MTTQHTTQINQKQEKAQALHGSDNMPWTVSYSYRLNCAHARLPPIYIAIAYYQNR